MQTARFGNQGANTDAGVHPAMLAEVADAAAVGVASLGLQLLDDLHGADLGRTCDGAARETGAQQIDSLPAIIELAMNGGDQMVHCRKGLYRKEVRDADRARSAHPPDIVAQQIHDHQIL